MRFFTNQFKQFITNDLHLVDRPKYNEGSKLFSIPHITYIDNEKLITHYNIYSVLHFTRMDCNEVMHMQRTIR